MKAEAFDQIFTSADHLDRAQKLVARKYFKKLNGHLCRRRNESKIRAVGDFLSKQLPVIFSLPEEFKVGYFIDFFYSCAIKIVVHANPLHLYRLTTTVKLLLRFLACLPVGNVHFITLARATLLLSSDTTMSKHYFFCLYGHAHMQLAGNNECKRVYDFTKKEPWKPGGACGHISAGTIVFHDSYSLSTGRLSMKVFLKRQLARSRLSAIHMRSEIDAYTSISKHDGYTEFLSEFFGADQDNGLMVLCLEFCDIDMRDFFAKIPESALHTDQVFQLVSAVEFLHNQCHLVHGDLKPENILFRLVGGNYHPILADLGTTVPIGSLVSGGTLRYLRPDVNLNSRKSAYADDVFSLMLVLIEFSINHDSASEFYNFVKMYTDFNMLRKSMLSAIDATFDSCDLLDLPDLPEVVTDSRCFITPVTSASAGLFLSIYSKPSEHADVAELREAYAR